MKENQKSVMFGENVPGFEIPVLNEREIRAAAGLLFLATFLSLMFILFNKNFVPIKFVITFFLTDFIIRVFISPRYSPSLILGRLIVRNQNPEYVGARQKMFAWHIGFGLSAIMFVFLVLINSYSPITGIGCLICLIFLFFEASFGICLGCKVYSFFFKSKAQYCPGEICNKRTRQKIQKTSASQFLVLLVFVGLIVLATRFLQDEFSKKPGDLFGINTEKSKQ